MSRDLIARLRTYDPAAKLVDRLREHDLCSYPEEGDWQDHYGDRADDLLKEAADRIAALEAEASEGERLRQWQDEHRKRLTSMLRDPVNTDYLRGYGEDAAPSPQDREEQ